MSRFNNNQAYADVNATNLTQQGLDSIKDYVFSVLMTNDKIKSTYIDSIGVVDVFEVADAAERIALSAGEGDIAIQADNGSVWIYGNSSTWIEIVMPYRISTLTDVVLNTPEDRHFLTYNQSTGKWNNRILQLSELNDTYLTSVTDGQFLRFVGGQWVNAAVDLKTNINSLDDVVITSASTGQLLQYSTGAWRNINNPYALNSDLTTHTGDSAIHRSIGVPTLGYVPVGNGGSFDTSLLNLNLLEDVIITTPATNSTLRYNGTHFVDSLSEPYGNVTASRDLTSADVGKTLYINETTTITLTIPQGLSMDVGALIKIVSMNNNRVVLKCANYVLVNGRFNVLHGNAFYLYCYGADNYICFYDADESRLYKNKVVAPVLGYSVDTSYVIEHTSEDHNYLAFSYVAGSNRWYLTYNTNTNAITNSYSTSGYLFGTDIINVNNATYYSVEFDGSANLRMISTTNRYSSITTTAISTQCERCGNRILYDSGNSRITIPFVNTSDIFFVALVSLDLGTISQVSCTMILTNVIKVLSGWHFNYGVMIAEDNSNYMQILIGNDTVSFMNDSSRPGSAYQLDAGEHIEEARSTDKSGRFYFMTRNATDYIIWSLNDVLTGAMRLFTIPCVSSILYQPATIRDNVLYIVNNEQYQSGTYLSGVVKVHLTNFKVERDSNILDLGSNSAYISFLLRRTYGVSVIGLPYNNIYGNILYKAIV